MTVVILCFCSRDLSVAISTILVKRSAKAGELKEIQHEFYNQIP